MFFILIYAITGWKIKKKNNNEDLWKAWKQSAWMEVAVQLLYGIFYDTQLSFNNKNLSVPMLFVVIFMAAVRYSALILLYKAWKNYNEKNKMR